VYADNTDNTDNVRPHTIRVSTHFCEQNKMKSIYHPPYSPDFESFDFSLFGYLKGCLASFSFENTDEFLEIFQSILDDIEKVILQVVFLE
jgi:hypothetical protein